MRNCVLSKQSLTSIAGIANLKALEVLGGLRSNDDLAVLSRAPRLNSLHITGGVPVDANTIKVLRTFKKLTMLDLGLSFRRDKSVHEVSPAIRNQLQEALPRVRIVYEEHYGAIGPMDQ